MCYTTVTVTAHAADGLPLAGTMGSAIWRLTCCLHDWYAIKHSGRQAPSDHGELVCSSWVYDWHHTMLHQKGLPCVLHLATSITSCLGGLHTWVTTILVQRPLLAHAPYPTDLTLLFLNIFSLRWPANAERSGFESSEREVAASGGEGEERDGNEAGPQPLP